MILFFRNRIKCHLAPISRVFQNMPPRKPPRIIDSFLLCAQEQDTHFYKTRRFCGKRDAINWLRDHDKHCHDCEIWDSLMELVAEADSTCMKTKREGLVDFLDQHVSQIEDYTAKLTEERQEARKNRVKTKRVNRQLEEAQQKHQAEMDALRKQMEQQMAEQIASLKAQYEPKSLLARRNDKKTIAKKREAKKDSSDDSSSDHSSDEEEEDLSQDEESSDEKDDVHAAQVLPRSAKEAVKKSVLTAKSKQSKTVKKPILKKKSVTIEPLASLHEMLKKEQSEEARLDCLLTKSRKRISSLQAKIKDHPDHPDNK